MVAISLLALEIFYFFQRRKKHIFANSSIVKNEI